MDSIAMHKMKLRQTQRQIKLIKDTFQCLLAEKLNLDRVTAPIFVRSGAGINDDLSGTERKVSFTVKNMDDAEVEVVQSLAKWKRMALGKYGYSAGEGIYTDMNAIRRDDSVDRTHSIFVDQWDWEKVIDREMRSEEYLKGAVGSIVSALAETNKLLKSKYPELATEICEDIYFITAEELLQRYPDLNGKERENAIVKEYKTVFLMQIGAPLSNGEVHDMRAPDYDDWSLNGDLLVWDEVLGEALEISSMGIRVDAESLRSQLEFAGEMRRCELKYHKKILEDKLPLSIGGGIGQSRLCMLLLGKRHIGEVQVSIWPEDLVLELKEQGIYLL